MDEEWRQRAIEAFARNSAFILDALRQEGLEFPDLGAIKRGGVDSWKRATPILKRILPEIQATDVKECVVRLICVPWEKPAAAPLLIKEYWREAAQPGGGDHSLKWAIGNGLEIVGDKSVADDLLHLALDRREGTSRQMVVWGLRKINDSRVTGALMSLLDDPNVAGQAISALAYIADPAAKPQLEAFAAHKMTWIRNAAKRGLKRIEKKEAQSS